MSALLRQRVRLDTPGAIRSAAERAVREALRGARPPSDAAAIVAALQGLATIRGMEAGKVDACGAKG